MTVHNADYGGLVSRFNQLGGEGRGLSFTPHCRCIWHGVPCAKPATQEDGLCDWCGDRRPEDMRSNEFAQWSPTGEYLGLAGGTVTGYNHQAGWGPIPSDVRPTACWMEPRPIGSSVDAVDN